jgi:hypothetical protein
MRRMLLFLKITGILWQNQCEFRVRNDFLYAYDFLFKRTPKSIDIEQRIRGWLLPALEFLTGCYIVTCQKDDR